MNEFDTKGERTWFLFLLDTTGRTEALNRAFERLHTED